MIRELYCNMLRETRGMERFSREMDEEISGLLEGIEKKLDGQECGEYKDNVLYIACAAEEGGFVKGFKYAFRLFAECMQE